MDNGSRNYEVAGYRLPSVTTILGRTKDNSFLDSWIKRKGRKEAERIKNQSATRGTSMHKYLENYVLGKGYEDLTPLGQEVNFKTGNIFTPMDIMKQWFQNKLSNDLYNLKNEILRWLNPGQII